MTKLVILLLLVAPITLLAQESPRLILQITVDQLRGDLPFRYLDKMGDGGFRLLLDDGVVYRDAHHDHANTETIVGHTTLSTGAYPSVHGCVGNVWLDRKTGERMYNVEDARYPLLTVGADVNKDTEIDPTQRVARSDGRSPSAINVSTFSDELALHTAGKAKVFGVSVKDRAAIAMAGHAGKAFWFSKATGQFVSSKFYYDEYPEWVEQYNANDPTSEYQNNSWDLLLDQDKYLYGDQDDNEWETSMPGYGRTFPHQYGKTGDPYFTTFLTLSPAGDEITLDFAKAVVENENIGQDDITDYLSVSFSSTDYVGHIFGPSSLEAEDNMLRLDKTLANLFAFIDDKVGLKNTLIVLSADHGGPEPPPQLNTYGIEGNYVDPQSWKTEEGIQRLEERFGLGSELIVDYIPPYIYLDEKLIAEQKLDLAEVESAVAAEMIKLYGVHLAISSDDLTHGRVAPTAMNQRVLNNHFPYRSGNVFIVLEPHVFINDFDGLVVAATHGSPWSYDSFVPIIFAGAGLNHQVVYRQVHTVDIASTLSTYIGAKAPSGACGKVLVEVFD